MDKYLELLFDNKYDLVEKEVNNRLDKESNNSKLWYYFFLSQNNNYIDIDFNHF